jgi:hypothetical protein
VGCGSKSTPKLERVDAAPLLALAHRIGGEEACAQARDIPRLQARAIALVNSGRVPDDLQEPMMSAVGAVTAARPSCPGAASHAAPPARKLEALLRRFSR